MRRRFLTLPGWRRTITLFLWRSTTEMSGPPRSWLCYGQHSASCEVQVTVEKKKLAPTVACAPASASVVEGGSLTLRARASDPNNDALSYGWAVDAQRISADQESITFGSTGRSIGAHTATVTVTDVDGLTAQLRLQCHHRASAQYRPTVSLESRQDDRLSRWFY